MRARAKLTSWSRGDGIGWNDSNVDWILLRRELKRAVTSARKFVITERRLGPFRPAKFYRSGTAVAEIAPSPERFSNRQ
jgi:hypothetical protein